MSLNRLNLFHLFIYFTSGTLTLSLTGCLGDGLPPFPGTPPKRAVFGTPPPTVNPEIWFGDVSRWGGELYIYHSPHYQGNLFRRQAGMSTSYSGDDLKQVAFLSDTDRAFDPFANAEERDYQEQLALEAYQACLAQGLEFYYSIPYPVFPVQDLETVRRVHPEWFTDEGTLDPGHPDLLAGLGQAIRAFKTAMPGMSGIRVSFEEGNGNAYSFSKKDIENISSWLPSLLDMLDSTCSDLQIRGMASTGSIWHTNSTRRQAYEIVNRYPDIILEETATWPEENSYMPFWGFVPPADTGLLKKNSVAVQVLTDTEYLGQGKLPVVLPRWWQYLAQQTYLHGPEIAVARCFQGDEGGTATNFNRLNLQLFLEFLQEPQASLKSSLQIANEEMFGDDFPSRLTAIMIIAEDAIQAISGLNYINLLDHSQFPAPQFLDRDYLPRRYHMKAIDDLFEPPGTPLYPEETERPDTLDATIHWRWQKEVSPQTVDEYLLGIENAYTWLDNIQKEVDYLTLDFPPDQRRMLAGGYRDLLLLGRGMYQFVQGAAVHHRWYRLNRISKEEALNQLAPIAGQIRLIAEDAGESSLHLQQNLLRMADAFENLKIEKKSD